MLKLRFPLLLKPAAHLMLIGCSFSFSAEAGEIMLSRSIDWTVLTDQTRNGILYPSFVTFDGAFYNRETKGLPVFAQLIETGGSANVHVRLRNEVYEPLAAHAKLQDEAELKQREIAVEYRSTSLHKKPAVSFQMVPLRRNPQTGQIEKLIRFDIVITYDAAFNATRFGKKPFASNSVLASGDWYKIAIAHTGIHALSKSYLKSIGINVDAVDPRTIKIYGYGAGMLPQKNAIARFDDLPENAIVVEGENDGVLNDNDRVLFFARSQKDVWRYNAGHYQHITNIYDDVSYFFITYGGAAGKRVQQQAPQPDGTYTQVSEFDQYYAHEEELTNLIKSGRRWMGEEFSRSLSQSFNVNMGQVNPMKPVYIRSCVTAHSFALSTFTVSVNSSLPVITHTLPKVEPDFTRPYATDSDALKETTFDATSGDITVSYTYNQPIPGSIGWLDFFELNARCKLEQSDPQLLFRDSVSVGPGKASRFSIKTSSVVYVWDITFPASAMQMHVSMSEGTASFRSPTDTLREFISFTGQHFHTPVSATKIENQNLHGLAAADLFIITHPQFVNEAQTLAQFHTSHSKLKVHVILVGQIYNEFSSGAQDLCAIRDFLRLFYKRAATVQDQPKYVTLFGRASYDYKNRIHNNTNYVPTYESVESYNPEVSYCSDDFIGFLDDKKGVWDSDEDKGKPDDLDVAIGRLPAQDNEQARVMVNKIIGYVTNPVFGDWKTRVVFVADDGDSGAHQGATEEVANKAIHQFKDYNVKKIYIDAFKEQNTSGGARNPDAQSEIVRAVEQGAMIINYTGHGGEVGWASERILNTDDIQNWTNGNKLPLFFTATCEFSRFDDPERTSAGEMVLLNSNGGGIALFTTVRLVNTSGNRDLNKLFYNYAGLDSAAAFKRLKLGEIFTETKNAYRGTDKNERNFTLLGDPAMQLAYPAQRVVTTSIDQQPLSNIPDTIKAFEKVTISGKITDLQNNDLPGFSGVIYPSVYDKASLYKTLGAEPTTPPFTFAMQNNLIYRGKASVVNGKFSFSFIVPKDISYEMGYGRISYAADNGTTDAAGYYENLIVGNTSDSFPKDERGPEIRLYMNDEHFVYGGITDENPTLMVKLVDENGMNITGKGVGRDISMIINNDHTKSIVLNDFYQSRLDSYKEGEVLYKMKGLPQGKNVLTLRAYDIYNNSSDAMLEFVVATSEEMALHHVLNYPNPFTTNTTFHFDHNKAGEPITVQVQVFTISGKLIKTLQTDAVASGNHFDQLSWDGRDDYGDHIGKGVYIYKVKVKSASGKNAEEFQKLVILN